ncbi:HtaA domain-containing protein [Conexibacter stalactiti]|uniref:HtaA domain-containing protein n=1 Tax=Conexibacter stalactiti TaxID=1940611 RepID=A0ABU4HQX3_9ACTN|nr:HtaA domain-containing protein [Conexibacter stalactiti]MDW5595696.1 HtaA domain-containing protein [Conexibacter stalactiti]MEC5036338.1 HtaA domain-containing protein [Conexibacter stalactiti]
MLRSFSRPLRLLLAVLAFGAMTAAVPAAAQATVVSRGSFELLPRPSWVTYVARFGGTIRAISPGSVNATTNVLTAGLGGLTSTTYNLVSTSIGSGRAGFDGGIEYTVPSHGISVKLDDFYVTTTSPTSTVAQVWALADYQDIATGTLTGYRLTQIATVNLSGTFTGSTGPLRHSWSNAPLALTTDGALIFNGGTNGAYRVGDAFGSINWWVSL